MENNRQSCLKMECGLILPLTYNSKTTYTTAYQYFLCLCFTQAFHVGC